MEEQIGITQDNFERKYCFHRLKERFLTSSDLNLDSITPEGHENVYLAVDVMTPSAIDGLSTEDEFQLRMHGAQLCMQAAQQLKLPITTAITSQVIYQRFFAKNSFVDFDYREISMAALFLAGKVDETSKKTWDIAGAFSTVFNKQTQNPLDIIIKQERLILKDLGFELFRLVEHPHKYIDSFFHFCKVPNQVAQKAWYYLNDSYMTSLSIHFPPQIIAAGALYLAMRTCQFPMSTQPWWVLLEASFDQVSYIAATIYSLYSQEKMDFRKASRILEKASRPAYVNRHHEYVAPVVVPVPEPPKKVEPVVVPDKKSIKKKSRSPTPKRHKSKNKKDKDKKDKKSKKKDKSKDKKKKDKDKKKRKSKSKSKKTSEKQKQKVEETVQKTENQQSEPQAQPAPQQEQPAKLNTQQQIEKLKQFIKTQQVKSTVVVVKSESQEEEELLEIKKKLLAKKEAQQQQQL